MKPVYQSFPAVMLLALAMYMSSCTKTENKNTHSITTPDSTFTAINSNTATVTYSPDRTPLNSLFLDFRTAPPQHFSATAGIQDTVYTAGNARLIFYANSFRDKNGADIGGGNVDLELIELYKPGQVIANRSSTTTNGNLLTSGGQMYIKATIAGEEVFANTYSIAFPQPAAMTAPMELHYGSIVDVDSVVTWQPSPVTNAGTAATATIEVQNFTAPPPTPTVNCFVFDSCKQFGWVGCHHFNAVAPITDVNIIIADTNFNFTNTQIFMVFPTTNAVTRLYLYAPGSGVYSFGTGYRVPVGMPVKVVAMSHWHGVYLYSESDVTVNKDMSMYVHMDEQSLTYIQGRLSSF